MKATVLFVTSLLFSGLIHAQEINPEIYKKNIEILYDAAANGFKDVISDEAGTTSDGNKKFKCTRKVSGASDVFIQVDEESSQTYVAQFVFDDKKKAEAQLEVMINLALEVVSEKGLVRGRGTDINYDGYRIHTLEYDSDNIDLLGKYPSFSFGILRDSDPPFIQMNVNEPLWK